MFSGFAVNSACLHVLSCTAFFLSLVAASIGVTSDCVPHFIRLKSHADHVQFLVLSSVSRQHLQFSSVLETFWHHLPHFRREGPLDVLRSLRLLKQNNLQCGADHQLSFTPVLPHSSDQTHLVIQESSACAIPGKFWLIIASSMSCSGSDQRFFSFTGPCSN